MRIERGFWHIKVKKIFKKISSLKVLELFKIVQCFEFENL